MNALMHWRGIAPPVRWNRFVRRFGLADAAANQNHILRGYDIVERDDGSGRISLSVPGFDRDDLTVEQRGPDLVVTGSRKREAHWPESDGDSEGLLWHGYSQHAFRRVFRLGNNVDIADSRLENGLLHIDLRRAPESAVETRRIPIARPTERPAGDSLLGRLRGRLESAIDGVTGWWHRTAS